VYILIDSREQTPLEFSHSNIDGVYTRKLEVGDYGCEFKNGYIPPVFFERKSIADLIGTLTSGMERFKKEIQRSKDSQCTLILIIEGSLLKCSKGIPYSKVDPWQVIKTVFTLFVKYGIIPVFCKNREEMSLYIAEYYSAIGRNMIKTKGFKPLDSPFTSVGAAPEAVSEPLAVLPVLLKEQYDIQTS